MSGLFNSPLADTALGLVVVWFAAASLCSGVVEVIASALGFRAKHLWRSIARLLDDSGTADEPGVAAADALRLAKSPGTGTLESPLYEFIDALPGITHESIKRVGNVDPASAAEALATLDKSRNFKKTQLGKLVSRLPSTITQDTERMREWLERWLNGHLDTVSKNYRRNVRWWSALFALAIVLGGGLDTIGLAERLYNQPAERTLLIAEANRVVRDGTDEQNACDDSSRTSPDTGVSARPTFDQRLECAQARADALTGLKVSSWQDPPSGKCAWLWFSIGILLSWVAVLAGAPFWFDVLKRLMGTRAQAPTAK